MDARKYLAELIGTFILVVIGSMSIVAAGAMSTPIPVLVAPFGFGLGLLAAIQAVGYVSGGHFNPAVTLGALLDRRIDVMNAIGYVVAQVDRRDRGIRRRAARREPGGRPGNRQRVPRRQDDQCLRRRGPADRDLPARHPDRHQAGAQPGGVRDPVDAHGAAAGIGGPDVAPAQRAQSRIRPALAASSPRCPIARWPPRRQGRDRT